MIQSRPNIFVGGQRVGEPVDQLMRDAAVHEVHGEGPRQCCLIAAFVDRDVVRRTRLRYQRQQVDAERLEQPPMERVARLHPEMIRAAHAIGQNETL